MHIYMNERPSLSRSAVALGFFDGVHIGHRELIKKTVAEAKKIGGRAVVYTFSEHPSHVISPDKKVKTIYSNRKKAEVFESLGVDVVIFDDFKDVKNFTPLEFVQNVLINTFDAESVICGYNFRFGKGNTGDIDTLSSIISSFGRKLFVIPPVCAGDEPVSSNRIRALIESGDVRSAHLLLSQPYTVVSKVVHGKHIGHSLGYPTANTEFEKESVVPLRGVYFTKALLCEKEYIAVTNVGLRPTIHDGAENDVCETHIIGFDGDFYGENLSVSFYARARDEREFDSLASLSSALRQDVENSKKYFENEDV